MLKLMRYNEHNNSKSKTTPTKNEEKKKMKSSMMSVKAMIDLYVRYGVEQETWTMLYSMHAHGLISLENWEKFYNTCKGWERDGNAIRDEDGIIIYRTDEDGYWHKVR